MRFLNYYKIAEWRDSLISIPAFYERFIDFNSGLLRDSFIINLIKVFLQKPLNFYNQFINQALLPSPMQQKSLAIAALLSSVNCSPSRFSFDCTMSPLAETPSDTSYAYGPSSIECFMHSYVDIEDSLTRLERSTGDHGLGWGDLGLVDSSAMQESTDFDQYLATETASEAGLDLSAPVLASDETHFI